ncbi:MAG: hypothetical protein ACLS6O_02020 [Bifidobacterium sp.]
MAPLGPDRRVVHEEHLPGQQGLRRPRRQDLRYVALGLRTPTIRSAQAGRLRRAAGELGRLPKLCKKLKNAGIEPFLEPNADEPSRFIDAFQGSILEKKGVDPTTLSTQDNQTPGTDELEAVKEYIRLYDEGGVTRDTVGISGDDMKTQFTNGQVAMIVDGAWDLPPSNRPA